MPGTSMLSSEEENSKAERSEGEAEKDCDGNRGLLCRQRQRGEEKPI